MPGRSFRCWPSGRAARCDVYLPQLAEFYGETAIRDHGLSASEGRMTIPLADGTSAGLLDFYHHYFDSFRSKSTARRSPTVLEGHELEVGRTITSC